MSERRTHFLKRIVSIAAFVLALIVLTGTPGKIRKIALERLDTVDGSEFCSEAPLRGASVGVLQ